jgi:phosphate transport system substrate-binding protein
VIKTVRSIAVALSAAALLSGGVASAQSVDLTGAGATFPYPIYSKWFSDYAQSTGVKINYQSIGSGGGIRQLSEQTVDFGASDGPMSDQELAGAKGGAVLHFPTVMGAVVITYNVPGLNRPLNLTGDATRTFLPGRSPSGMMRRLSHKTAGWLFPTLTFSSSTARTAAGLPISSAIISRR